MAKGTPVKEGKAGENRFRDIDKTGNPKRKPLSRRVGYGYKAHAGPQHIPMSEIGANMADDLWDQEMTRDLFGDNPRGAASNKRVSDKLKNVMASKKAPADKGRPPIPPYKPKGSTSSKKIPAKKKPKLPLTGLARYGNQIR